MSSQTRNGVIAALLLPLATTPATAQQQAATQPKQRFASVVEALAATPLLAGRQGPASVNWIDGGSRFSFTMQNAASDREEIRRYDPETQRDELILESDRLTLPGTGTPLAYRSFQWSLDSRFLVFETDFRPIFRRSGVADFYLYDVERRTLQLAADDARTAELSPDGRLLGFERGGDLFVYDLGAGAERRLTSGGNDSIFNGVFDWVYEEEFGLAQAWAWSSDGRRIAFWQTDERGIPAVQITDYEGKHPEWVRINYPKVGDPNPRVRIGIVPASGGDIVWFEPADSAEHYIPRIYWTSDPNTLAVVTLNRRQNELRLHFVDARTGQRRQVLRETSPAWIDVFDFFAGVDHYFFFPEGLREFFWISDRDGYQHVYRYDYNGRLLNQVTKGAWSVTRVEAIDPARRLVYYASTEPSPLERHLYSIRFDGREKRKLTQTPGTHQVDMSPNGRYYIDRWSNTRQHTVVELWSTAGRKLATLEDNAATDRFLATHVYSPLELFQFTTRDGVTLDGSMVRPPDFDPSRRYPVVVSIYGGPGAQQVYNRFATQGWEQYLAQQGYIVVGLNNRGSGNYGRDFMEIVYRRLGEWESHDFAEAAHWLGRQPWADPERIAIMGTSYGGYSTVYTMLRHPGVFRLGISNSPVTDWKLYDTIYTERYMDLLELNEDGYRASATLPLADRLDGYLLLVHSAMDENVHPQNTMQLLTALTNAGKDAELRFYPPGAHGAAYNRESYVTMFEVYANTLCEHLAASCEPVSLNRD